MSSPLRSLRILTILAVLLAVAGCQTAPNNTYEAEKFDSAGIFSRNYGFPSVTACEAARRTLLSQGYVISAFTSNQIDARKNFQPQNSTHVQIAFRVVCADNGPAGGTSSMFVNALEERYALKKVNSAASLGVGALGSVSLPFSSSDDSLVKVASETVTAGPFYENFFELVERFLGTRRDELPPEPAPTPASAPAASVPVSRTSPDPLPAQ
ncbi:DUF2242 domain-containing protein [uncultured Oxalicibacterium sp.]|uniref:DUF2242 domain-containing protein n=1 Tax=uncultured Oxalicibacterium sp. TaxID=1168540 RepID=UPI0025F47A9A|nr:DUF2242 domain-containing protein [uncultured Oxalicibacterium sp.]